VLGIFAFKSNALQYCLTPKKVTNCVSYFLWKVSVFCIIYHQTVQLCCFSAEEIGGYTGEGSSTRALYFMHTIEMNEKLNVN